jgi:predicted acetyltransferase
MTATVRTINEDELEAFGACMGSAFLSNQGPEWAEFRRGLDFNLDRTFSAFENKVLCGTARSFPTAMRLPGGGSASAAAVTQVTVRPTHRRRGHLTRMMQAQLTDAAERGEAMAILVAAEWPIYGRFGYGPAIYHASYELDSRRTRFIETGWKGTVELVSNAELREVAPAVHRTHQERTPGSIVRDDEWWDVIFGIIQAPSWKADPHEFRAVHRGASGTPDGFAMWKTKERWENGVALGEIEVQALITTTDEAYVELWRFLTDIDLVAKVWAWGLSVDEPLQHLVEDGRVIARTNRVDHIWVRMLDVAKVLSERAYAAPGRVVLEVVDDQIGRGGRFALDGGPDGATCAPTSEAADLTMPIATLGAASLGGTSFAALATARRVDEDRAGALALATRMFAVTPAPWCSSSF